MSRLAKTKERKRKKRIKATACGLALSLLVCSTQYLGTHALFTDTEDVVSDLDISTGDVDIELDSDSSKISSDFKGKTYTKQFKITNHGTLKQNIKLKLNMDFDSSLSDKNWIENYTIKFDDSLNINSVSDLINGEEIDLKTKEGDLFILNPGETITANITIQTKDKGLTDKQKEEFSNKSFDLKLNVKALQIGHENVSDNGFYDIEVRTDTFIIAPMIFGITFTDDNTRTEDIKISFSNFIDSPKSIELVENKGGLSRDFYIKSTSNNTLEFEADLYNTRSTEWYIDETFSGNHYVTFEFKYENETKYFKFEFKVGANSTSSKPSVDVKIEELDSNLAVLSEVGMVKALIEESLEVDGLSETDIIEVINEEESLPVEPEVVEPPKEEEVLPVEPEIIDTPNNEEIVAQKKEEIEE